MIQNKWKNLPIWLQWGLTPLVILGAWVSGLMALELLWLVRGDTRDAGIFLLFIYSILRSSLAGALLIWLVYKIPPKGQKNIAIVLIGLAWAWVIIYHVQNVIISTFEIGAILGAVKSLAVAASLTVTHLIMKK